MRKGAPAMPDIRAVLFDLYGTLIHVRTDEEDLTRLWKPLSLFYAYHGALYTPQELRKAYREGVRQTEATARAHTGVDDPEIRLEDVFRALFMEKGARVTPETLRCVGGMFRACSTDIAQLYPGAGQLIDDLRAAGKTVVLLSNAQRIFTEPEMRMLGLYDRFDKVYISSDWGVKKPAAEYFQYALRALDLPPEQVAMVGNSTHDDMRTAHALGLHTCHLNTDNEPTPDFCDLALTGADYAAVRRWLLGK